MYTHIFYGCTTRTVGFLRRPRAGLAVPLAGVSSSSSGRLRVRGVRGSAFRWTGASSSASRGGSLGIDGGMYGSGSGGCDFGRRASSIAIMRGFFLGVTGTT